MGKNDFLSPKDIANRIKAKGLQKLRWYCQMCGKQCRDENGFKCHLSSESHKRQMEVFGQAPTRIIEGFSEEFEKSFLDHLRRSHPFSRISANVVYNEYINDRNHIHMNSTKWVTLTEFVAHLGRTGQCKVDDTPKGWYIMIVQKDPAEELDKERRGKREKAEMEEEERHQHALQAQIERAREAAAAAGGGGGEGAEGGEAAAAAADDVKPEDLEQLGFTLAAGRAAAAEQQQRKRPAAAFEEDEEGRQPAHGSGPAAGTPHKRSKLEEMMERDLRAKQQQQAAAPAGAAAAPGLAGGAGPQRRAAWLAEGIVVKVVSRALREHGYYKQKGVVVRVVDRYLGEIEMAGSGDVVRVDQAELETVIPQPGGAVLVLSGALQGAKGTLVGIDERRFQAEVAVADRRTGEESSVWLDYEDVSKRA